MSINKRVLVWLGSIVSIIVIAFLVQILAFNNTIFYRSIDIFTIGFLYSMLLWAVPFTFIFSAKFYKDIKLNPFIKSGVYGFILAMIYSFFFTLNLFIYNPDKTLSTVIGIFFISVFLIIGYIVINLELYARSYKRNSSMQTKAFFSKKMFYKTLFSSWLYYDNLFLSEISANLNDSLNLLVTDRSIYLLSFPSKEENVIDFTNKNEIVKNNENKVNFLLDFFNKNNIEVKYNNIKVLYLYDRKRTAPIIKGEKINNSLNTNIDNFKVYIKESEAVTDTETIYWRSDIIKAFKWNWVSNERD